MNKKEEGKGEEMRKVDLQKEDFTIASKSVAKTSWHILISKKKHLHGFFSLPSTIIYGT